MTVPVVGSGSRKSPWRYMPEIHASRFSISGSFRPKLGLLILSVLLVLSVVLLVLPFITKLPSESQDSRLAREPSNRVISDFLRSTWQTRPNHVFSPVGLTGLLSLISPQLDEKARLNMAKYRSTNTTTFFRANQSSFFTNYTVHRHPDVGPSHGILEQIRSKVESTNSLPQLAILNTNRLSVRADNFSVLDENFYSGPNRVLKTRMAVFRTKARTLKLKETETIEVKLNDGYTLQILLPHTIDGLSAVVDSVHRVMSTTRQQKSNFNILTLKVPVIDLEESYETESILRAFGIKTISHSPMNITHSTSLELFKGEPVVSGRTHDKNEEKEEVIICDRAFLFNVFSAEQSLPILSGMYRQPPPREG